MSFRSMNGDTLYTQPTQIIGATEEFMDIILNLKMMLNFSLVYLGLTKTDRMPTGKRNLSPKEWARIGYGILAKVAFNRGDFPHEYVGERFKILEAERREKRYSQKQ